MPRTYVSVDKKDLIEVLLEIARNRRVGAMSRIKSVDMIAKLKGYSGFQVRTTKAANVPPQADSAVPVQVNSAPDADLLGLNR